MGGEADMTSVVVVTLAYNNIEETRKTLASVAFQRVGPSRYLVVDSSDPDEANEIKKLAALGNAEYHWVAPRGVYPAMNHALSRLADNDYVWFINSSDWLSGPDSIAEMHSALDEGAQWVIGGLSRLGDTRNPFHPIPVRGSDFVELLRTGAIGFPHPAALMSVATIRRIGGFDTALRIAADYKLALEFVALAGEPAIARYTVSVHVPTGLTSKNRLRHVWEKLVARRRAWPHWNLLSEAKTQTISVFGYMGVSPAWKKRISEFPLTQAFEREMDSWPEGL